MRNATDIFSEWALGGKDEGMEKNHADAVSEILTHLIYGVGTSFTFIDAVGNYFCSDLMKWIPEEKVDFIHSMEVMYYFENPGELIDHMKLNWLKPGGKMIMGVDYYQEHERSHTWPTDLGTHMTLLSEKNWISLFNDHGFSHIENFRANVQDDFPGTLVISGVLDCI